MFILLASVSLIAGGAEVARNVPTPLPSHPGNVFLAGAEVRLALPAEASGEAKRWRVLDDALNTVREGAVEGGGASVGELPIGWYRMEFLDADGAPCGFTTAAVLARLAEPVPQDSPICVDVALSWLEDDPEAYDDVSSLAALAGVNWVRDRIHWREVESGPGESVPGTKYDVAARVQYEAGLKVLQVFHTVPKWAYDGDSWAERPRMDLRHLYRFCKSMAGRFEGRVQAWEPWNEGNAANFGGRTIDELSTLQKVAYLGFKAGDPNLTVCWNPLGGVNTGAQADCMLRNEIWPYCDVFSIHSYDWAHAYASLWEGARRAACGKPIWVTECDRGMKADPDSPVGDYTPEYARLKAQFVVQSYTCSLYSGSSRHFHFILGPYMEGERTIQFGLLRDDYTPRPSYVALAALGRFLAGARCLGRLEVEDRPDIHMYVFRSRPGGRPRDVMVAWVEKSVDWPARGAQSIPWAFRPPVEPEAAYDCLGRAFASKAPENLTSSPVFVVLPKNAADKLILTRIESAKQREGTPCPVVFQFDTPGVAPIIRKRAWTQEPERVFAPGSTVACQFVVYNFSGKPASGAVTVADLPSGYSVSTPRWDVTIPPMGRRKLELQLTTPDTPVAEEVWLSFRGDFGDAGRPALAFQVDRPKELPSQ